MRHDACDVLAAETSNGATPNIPIPDNNPVGIQSVINITGSSFVRDVGVQLQINHTWQSDVSGDALVDLNDVPAFSCVLIDPASAGAEELCAADINLDGLADGRDVEYLVALLLAP